MKYLKNAFELYINSSIHVSLAIVAFTMISCWEYGLELNWELILFIFFASITAYNFVKYAGIAKLYHRRLARNLRLIQIFSLLSFIALIYFAFQLPVRIWIATGFLGILTLFYALPLFGDGKNLRSLPGLKIFIIALVWGGSTVLVPLIFEEELLGMEYLVDFFQRVAFVVVLTIPFEIRDLEYDEEALGTIPQKLGVLPTKVFGTTLLVLIVMIELFQLSFNSGDFISLGIITVITGILLWKAHQKQPKYYCSFWVESIPLLYLGVFWFFRHYS